ncbi:MAG: 50S ribosomal protein L5 [Schleiferiaceae bacterium]|mgnify:FL=1|jgi:large subunit ribosomal protein L5|nr:MAG: 50S ribosomal protein L5 [Owenweeksia sp. TMED14]|tara:strand:+ start:87401 stop:87940 length:540 start_codon:yes stop_codon:yes gene_type:complete
MESKLKNEYQDRVVPAMKERFGYSNNLQVPRLEKIVLSQGIGAAVADKKLVDAAVEEMTLIAGQRAVPTKSKKDISNFKLRKGMPVGARVTLRGTKMYDFLERLLVSSLPRIRDFQGIKEGFDGRGNFTFGVTEQIIFPEIEIDKVNRISGMDITLVSSAKTDMECKALLQEFGMPFKK